MRPEEFRSLVPCLGTYHLTKTVLKCIGKYLEGSGAELTWLEAGIFGPTVIEKSVLNGGHYSRCLEGMQLLSESLWRLLCQEFFREKGTQPYIFEFVTLNNLRAAVQCRDTAESQRYLAEFGVASKIMEDLKLFIKSRSEAKENFKFWATFLGMMDLIHDLLRADREGNWELHLDAVQRALIIFAAFDCTNYMRWCSLYLEDMRCLPETAPSVYHNFTMGSFSIKDKPG